MNWEVIGYTASIWVIPVLLAVTLHEAAHGWVAWKLGDGTAKNLGRVTFNPFKHVDLFGTVLLPALLLFGSGGRMMFGFAKPVPVNFANLRNPRRDMVLVAVAGPASNFILALIATCLLHITLGLEGAFREWITLNLVNAIWINILLCVFNLLPLPPLDGGRVAVGLLPAPIGLRLAKLEKVGFLIILGGFFLLPYIGNQFGVSINIFWWLVGAPAEYIMTLIIEGLGPTIGS